MVRLTDCLNTTIAVDWDVKQQSNNNNNKSVRSLLQLVTWWPPWPIFGALNCSSLIFSAINRSSFHCCGFKPCSGHVCNKPSSVCGWSGSLSQGSPFFTPPFD